MIKIFIDKRSEVESEKKKARKKPAKKKKEPEVIKVPEIKEEEKPFIDVKGDYPQSFYYKQTLHY